MRKNLYTKTINDIKISENAVNSAIENIYSKQSNDNIIDIKKSKNKKVVCFIIGCLNNMAGNGQGLALLGDLKNVRPELKPN